MKITHLAKIPGSYQIVFTPAVAQPFTFSLLQGKINALKSTGTIVDSLVLKAGSNMNIKVIPRDQFENVLTLTVSDFSSASITFQFK